MDPPARPLGSPTDRQSPAALVGMGGGGRYGEMASAAVGTPTTQPSLGVVGRRSASCFTRALLVLVATLRFVVGRFFIYFTTV